MTCIQNTSHAYSHTLKQHTHVWGFKGLQQMDCTHLLIKDHMSACEHQ